MSMHHVMPGVHRAQKRALASTELKAQVVMSHTMDAGN